jgi:hypothetical protein
MIRLEELILLNDQTRTIAQNLYKDSEFSVHSAQAITVPPVINHLEENKTPYTLVAVPDQGYIIIGGNLVEKIQSKVAEVSCRLKTIKLGSPEYHEEIGKKKLLGEMLSYFRATYQGTND